LRDKLEQTILNTITETYVNGDKENRLPNTSNISFDSVKGEEILLLLSQKGICVSTGSACNSSSLEPSHVLTAMQLPQSRIRSVRFSLSRYNTEEEINYILQSLQTVIKSLRNISSRM
jgi:cysteine desulfurase